jgi:ATP-dependent exoDNAse (exonuclease V) alpha subunit
MSTKVWPPDSIREVCDHRECSVDILLCGKNETRHRLNAHFADSMPENDHPLIVTENSYDWGVFNGEIYPVSYFIEKGIPTTLTGRNGKRPVKVDLGYAITVHKAQGSQWDRVGLFVDEASLFRDMDWRWLYTGVTRAAKELVVIR